MPAQDATYHASGPTDQRPPAAQRPAASTTHARVPLDGSGQSPAATARGLAASDAIDYHAVGFAHGLDLAGGESDRMHVIDLKGRGTHLQLPAGWVSLWLPLRGDFEMEAAHSHWALRCGDAMTWNDGALRGAGHGPGWCLVLACPERLWRRTMRAHAVRPVALLPWERRCPRELKRMLVHLARMAARGGLPRSRSAALLGTLHALLCEYQAPARRLLDRCCGRSLQHKQRTLQRLLRVERMVRSNQGSRIDLLRLARAANYSPHYLIRIYRNVFGETPAEHAIRLRTLRAWELVHGTRMPVCEITESLGFESQSAFCRAFKNAFGMTTGQARRQPPSPRADEGCNVYSLRTPVRPPSWAIARLEAPDSNAA